MLFNKRKGRGRMFFRLPFIAIGLVLLLGTAALVGLLWNAVLSPVLGIRTVTYAQAVGLLILCRILFGSFHFGQRGRPGGMRPGNPLREKWMNMTPEEREQFKLKLRERCANRTKGEEPGVE